MLEKMRADIPFIENKYHKTNEPFNPFARMNYHGWECAPSTGFDDTEMAAGLEAYIVGLCALEPTPNEPTLNEHALIKAKAFAYVLDHMRIGVDSHDCFPCFYNWSRPLNRFTINKWNNGGGVSPESAKFLSEYTRTGDIVAWLDYDHSVPDWNALYTLGFYGIRERAKKYREERKILTRRESAYFESIDIEYSAILRLISRVADLADSCDFEKASDIASSMRRLALGAPETMLDRLELIYIYFLLSESVDSYQVRSLGSGIDRDLSEPYDSDLASGIPAEKLDCQLAYFLMQFSAIGNYWGQPMYLGGTNFDGGSRVCAMSYRLLDIYDALDIYNPKIQVKYSPNTPKRFLEKILDMIRRGHSSFVFVCDDNIIKSFENRGIPYERAYDYDIKGCYEFALRAGEFSTAPAYINLLAPIVRVLAGLDGAVDYDTVEQAYFDKLELVFENMLRAANEMESRLGDVNPAPMLSATITRSLEKARDAYNDGAELNTTALVVGGIASAVDALMAIKYLVYVDRLTTLDNLKRVLAENWSDGELRARALGCPHKYGCGDPDADALAAKIADFAASFQGRPNVRGGYYKITVHSARMFIDFGRKMPATPDGRLAGEETSKNASAVQGMDRNGVTALIRSALSIKPARFTEGFGFDIMLHKTAVAGNDGLAAMLGLLRAYDTGGGSTVQFNIFDASVLKDAQENPRKYQSLQIRVCGWNALWNNLPKSEQDKYIERAEKLQ